MRRRKRYLQHTRWRGAKILPYVDIFLLFGPTREVALTIRRRVNLLLTKLGLLRHSIRGCWEPTHTGHHLGIDIDTTTGYFLTPAAKPEKLAKLAQQLLQRFTRASKWLPVQNLHSFAGHAQYMFLVISAARLFLRELHSVLGDKWGGRVRLTPHLRHDLQWYTHVPNNANRKNIHRRSKQPTSTATV
jgi:hypothetical protein